jgi:hypothetical protein
VPASDDVRVVAEFRDKHDWRIRTSELAALRRAMGAEVLAAFCRCYVHGDRLESLGSMFTPVLIEAGRDSVRGRRDFMAFFAFTVGTLREFSTALLQLKRALRRHGVLDPDGWKNRGRKPGLNAWQRFGKKKSSVHLRNTVAFHVDPKVIAAGLATLARRVDGIILHEGDSHLSRESWFRIAHVALLQGSSQKLGGLERLLGSIRPFLNPRDAIDVVFWDVLVRSGLKPLVVKIRSGTSLDPIDEPLPDAILERPARRRRRSKR